MDSLLAQIPKCPATYDIKLRGDILWERYFVSNMWNMCKNQFVEDFLNFKLFRCKSILFDITIIICIIIIITIYKYIYLSIFHKLSFLTFYKLVMCIVWVPQISQIGLCKVISDFLNWIKFIFIFNLFKFDFHNIMLLLK